MARPKLDKGIKINNSAEVENVEPVKLKLGNLLNKKLFPNK